MLFFLALGGYKITDIGEGNFRLEQNGYRYHLHKTKNAHSKFRYWRCPLNANRLIRCKGRAVLENPKLLRITAPHNHEPEIDTEDWKNGE